MSPPAALMILLIRRPAKFPQDESTIDDFFVQSLPVGGVDDLL
jgi:hypothetical protein